MSAPFTALNGDGIGTHFDGFLGVLQSANSRHAHDASIAQTTNHFFVRTSAIAYSPNFVFDGQIKQLIGIGLKHVKVQTKGFVAGEFFDSQYFGFNLVGCNGGTR